MCCGRRPASCGSGSEIDPTNNLAGGGFIENSKQRGVRQTVVGRVEKVRVVPLANGNQMLSDITHNVVHGQQCPLPIGVLVIDTWRRGEGGNNVFRKKKKKKKKKK